MTPISESQGPHTQFQTRSSSQPTRPTMPRTWRSARVSHCCRLNHHISCRIFHPVGVALHSQEFCNVLELRGVYNRAVWQHATKSEWPKNWEEQDAMQSDAWNTLAFKRLHDPEVKFLLCFQRGV